MDIVAVLDECLAEQAAGESLDSCLERYPELARELDPMLSAAQQLRVLQTMRLSQAQRLRAKVALRETLAGQRQPRPTSLLARFGAAPVAALLAVVLFMGVAITAVAGSQPGELGYGVRVVVERAPAWVQVSNEGRASAELAVAERRLHDVAASAADSGEVPPAALNALVRGVEAAAVRAAQLPKDERAALAERVTKHADELMRLANRADVEDATALRQAAQRIAGAAGKLEQRPPDDRIPTPTVASLVITPTHTPAATRTVLAVQQTPPASRPTATATKSLRARPTLVIPARTVLPPVRKTPVVPTIVVPTIIVPTREPTVVVPTREWEGTVTPPRRMTPPPVFTPRPTRERPTVVVPTVVIPTRVAPTRVVPTIVVPTIVVPTIVVPTIVVPTISVPTVRPTPDIPRRATRTPEATGTVTVAGDPATPTPRAGLDTPTPTLWFWVLPTRTRTVAPTMTPVATTPFDLLASVTPTAPIPLTPTATGTPSETPTPRGPRATIIARTSTPTAAISTPPPPVDTPVVGPTWMPTRPPRPR